MRARARWVVVGVVLLVLGVVALYWFNSDLTGVTLSEADGGRTWVIDVGEPRPMQSYGRMVITLSDPVTFPVDQIRAHDRFMCEGSTHSVHPYLVADWMDERGGSNNVFEEISVTTHLDGSVTVTCWAPGGRPAGPT